MRKQYSFLMEFYTGPSSAELGLGIGANVGSIAGTLGGGGYGIYKGISLANKLSGAEERNEIKRIILTSETPKECYIKLKKMGTDKALWYAAKVIEYKDSDWRTSLVSHIEKKNLAAGVTGGVTGGLLGTSAGAALGTIAGAGAGYGIGKALDY